jgi:threonine dehydratase
MAGDITFRYVQALVEDVVVVTDDEIRAAMGLLLSRAKLLTEPAGAAAVAALLGGRITLRGPAVAVLSGGNVDVERLGRLLLPEE